MSSSSILFFGTPGIAAHILAAIDQFCPGSVTGVVTQPDKPAGRGVKITSSPVKDFATERAMPIFQPVRLRKELPDFLPSISAAGPFDLGIVVAFGQILPRAILDLPRLGCINIHASLLPRWRGAAPMQRALMAGDTRTGVCLMQMDEGLDTGAVLATTEFELSDSDTFGTLHDQMQQHASKLLLRHLDDILSARLSALQQPTEGVTYADKILPAEAALRFDGSAIDLHNRIRGLSPTPGAFTFLLGKRLKILTSRVVETNEADEALLPRHPGSILRHHGRLLVRCAAGAIELLELQLEGKKRMTAVEFGRGTTLAPGAILGSESCI